MTVFLPTAEQPESIISIQVFVVLSILVLIRYTIPVFSTSVKPVFAKPVDFFEFLRYTIENVGGVAAAGSPFGTSGAVPRCGHPKIGFLPVGFEKGLVIQ